MYSRDKVYAKYDKRRKPEFTLQQHELQIPSRPLSNLPSLAVEGCIFVSCMSKTEILEVLPKLSADLLEAEAWYEQQQVGLGKKFLQAERPKNTLAAVLRSIQARSPGVRKFSRSRIKLMES